VSAHDVRKLSTCCLCGHLDFVGAGLIRLLVDGYTPRPTESKPQVAHPRCYLHEMGLKKLLSISFAELATVRICDVPPKTVQAILKRLGSARTP
jgi:hypothetical protein